MITETEGSTQTKLKPAAEVEPETAPFFSHPYNLLS